MGIGPIFYFYSCLSGSLKKMKVFVELTCGLEISSPLRVVMWLGRSYVIVKPQVIKV